MRSVESVHTGLRDMETTRAPRVLIVEDDHVIREVHAFLFVLHGWICQTVASGKEALGEQKRFAPDVVVLDLNLPDISGLEVAAFLRTAQPEIGLIAYSGEVDMLSPHELSSLGFDNALSKGAGFRRLERAAQQLIDRASAPEPLPKPGLDHIRPEPRQARPPRQ